MTENWNGWLIHQNVAPLVKGTLQAGETGKTNKKVETYEAHQMEMTPPCNWGGITPSTSTG